MEGLLERAFTEPGLTPLPDEAMRLLRAVGAPPRLGAHLRADFKASTPLSRLIYGI